MDVKTLQVNNQSSQAVIDEIMAAQGGNGHQLNQQSFNEMGQVLFSDPAQGLTIRAGQIFEGRTVKGGTNLIITMRQKDGFMYYMHADKARKVSMESFVNAVMYGDLQPRLAQEVDTERLSMAAIGLDALANRRTAEETIDFYGEGAAERFAEGGLSIG